MILLKFLIMGTCGFCFWKGGHNSLYFRRFIMPVILTLAGLFFTHSLLALTMLSSTVIFSLGYGDNSPFRHIFGNGWGRGVWGLLSGLALSLGLFIGVYIHLYWFIPYLALNFILENALKDIPQDVGDPIIGTGLASILIIIGL